MERMLGVWAGLDLRRRAVLVVAAVLTFAAVLSLAQIATRPALALLYSGLDPATAGEVVGQLEEMQVPSEIRGDAIYVSEDARDRVRLALARLGLPRQGQAGYELLDGLSGFSTTSDMFDAAYWRAKEGEIARTILAAPGVRAARVHIAVPTRRPFARESAAPTASVTLTMAAGALTVRQATAIRYLVALAVAGLEPEQVAVIDSRAGMVLAPGSESEAASAATEAAEREAKLKAEIEQLIAARVGRDKARVSVTVETDREAETVTETVIQPESRVIVHQDTEEISDQSQGQGGAVTVASNLPDGDAAGGEARKSARTETRERFNYDYSQVTRERVRAPGAIRRISVAVLVDGLTAPGPDGEPRWQPRPEEELAALRDLVVAAIGFDAARGDIVTVESLAFQPDASPGALVEIGPLRRFVERNAMTLLQLAVLAVVVILLAAMVLRPLLTQSPGAEPEAEAALLPGDGAAVAGARLDAPAAPETLAPPTPQERLETALAEDPERVIAVLQDWLEPEEQAA